MTNLLADRAMILFMWVLVAAPAISIVISPNGWRYAIALENQRSGNLETAEEQFKLVTDDDPNNVGAWYRLSEIALEQKRYEDALDLIDRAMIASGRFVDPPLGEQKATILLAMGRGRKAISVIKQLLPSRRADLDLSSLPEDVLHELLEDANFQVYFNKLAYLSAVGGVELENAARFIEAVLFHFDQEESESRLLLPYLHELNGDYEKAMNAYAVVLSQAESVLPPIEGLNTFLENQFRITEPKSKKLAEFDLGSFSGRYKVLHRMKLIAEKLSQIQRLDEIQLLIDGLPNHEKSESNLKLIVDDQEILEQASRLRSYLDTSAFVSFRQAEKIELKLLFKIVELDLTFVEKAKLLYEESLWDMERAIELDSAIEKFNNIRPFNSLMVRRTTDEHAATKQRQKNSAVLYFHYALILESNGRFEDAASAREKVDELGFEIDEMLF